MLTFSLSFPAHGDAQPNEAFAKLGRLLLVGLAVLPTAQKQVKPRPPSGGQTFPRWHWGLGGKALERLVGRLNHRTYGWSRLQPLSRSGYSVISLASAGRQCGCVTRSRFCSRRCIFNPLSQGCLAAPPAPLCSSGAARMVRCTEHTESNIKELRWK